MAKLRLSCPSCGKAVAVSETAKKARCPGCKSVIDVAAALAADLDPSTEMTTPSPQAGDAPAAQVGDGADAQAPEKAATGAAAGTSSPAGEAPAEGGAQGGAPGDGAEGEAPAEERPSRRVSRAVAARPPVVTIAGVQSWIIVAAAGLVLFLVLMLVFVEISLLGFCAAVGMASGLGLYFEAALARITRVNPSSPGYSHAPMVWGLLGCVPFVGVILYVLLRPKLVANSPEDIASPGMEPEEIEDEGKVLAPTPASPWIVLVLIAVVGWGVVFWREPAFKVMIFEVRGRSLVPSRTSVFNQSDLRMRVKARSPLKEYGSLTYALVMIEGEKELNTDHKGPVVIKKLPTVGEWTITMDEGGRFRVDVSDSDGDILASAAFRVRGR